jgi:voltage-gated potassium channel
MQRFSRWLESHHVTHYIGLAGVDRHERAGAKLVWRVFTSLMIVAAFSLLIQWQMESLGPVKKNHLMVANWVTWGFFVFEWLLMLLLVEDRWRFSRRNWMLPVIVLFGLVYILCTATTNWTWMRYFQPVLALCIMVPSIRMLWYYFVDGRLSTTLLASCIIVIAFGLLVAGVDPSVTSPWDGIWWALATVSTVGYGDVVPSSALGRILGTGLIILGLGIFVVITANFLALILRREKRDLEKREQEIDRILSGIYEIKTNQAHMLSELEHLKARLDEKEAKGPDA